MGGSDKTGAGNVSRRQRRAGTPRRPHDVQSPPDADPRPPADRRGPPACSLSIVIPAYNEEGCIGDSLADVMRFAAGYPAVGEVIVVDDGSTDRTTAIVVNACSRYRQCRAHLELIRHPRNLGKGAAVRNGLLHAAGEIVLFTDADLSAPLFELPRLVEPIAAGDCDIVIGSRAMDRSLIGVRQRWFRETAGKLFNWIVRGVTRLPIRDTQCGFKAFRRSAVLPIFQMQRIGAFAFDVEVLYVASKLGLTIREVPVHWSHVPHTKVSLLRDSVRMFVDVLAIRLHGLRGAYRWNGSQ